MKKTTKTSAAPKASKKVAEPVAAKPAKAEKAPAKKAVKAVQPELPVAKAAPKAKAAPAKAAPKAAKAAVTPEQRYLMVQEAAYFIAEKHGFNGDSKYFWALAEAQIEDQLK